MEWRDATMTDVLTVGALGSVLLSRWKMLVIFVVAGMAVGVGYGMLAPATYTSKAVLFVIAGPADKDGYYQAAQFAEKRAATYPALVSAPQVIDRTTAQLQLDLPESAVISMLSANNPTDSPLVEVAATAGNPKLAQDLADTAADYLASYAVELEASATKQAAVTIKKAVPAREPRYPSSPSPMVLGALGALAGGALGVVAALVSTAWRRRPRRPAEVSAIDLAGAGASVGPRPLDPHPPTLSSTQADGTAEPAEDVPGAAPADLPDTAQPGPAPASTAGWPEAPAATPGPSESPRTHAVAGHVRRWRRAHAPAGPARVDGLVAEPPLPPDLAVPAPQRSASDWPQTAARGG
jgi:capsular polysaccharide biosynthesis protein